MVRVFLMIFGGLIVIILVGIVLFLAYRYYRNRYRKDTQDLENLIKSLGKKHVKKTGGGGIVIGVIKNESIRIEGFGKESEENNKIPDEKTLFELASIGKIFTVSAMQILVDRGDVSWSETLDRHLDKGIEFCEDVYQITLRHLATHTSGLPRFPRSFFHKVRDERNPYRDLSEGDLYNYLKNCEENTELGRYAYSNLGMGLLGHVLERLCGKSYESIVKDEILKKLDMEDTTITLSEEQKGHLAQGYDVEGKPTPLWENKLLAGAGSFISNAEDMIKFIKANFTPAASKISESLIKTHNKVKDSNIGLGWHYYSRFMGFMMGGEKVIWHNGTTGGYSSFISVDKENKCGVIILSSSKNDVTVLGIRLAMLVRDISFAYN